MKRVRRMIFQFASDFNTRGALSSDLAAAEMSRIAIMKFLMYTRHNYTHFLFRKPSASNSSAVRLSRSSSRRTETSRSTSRRCRLSPGPAPEACTGNSRRPGLFSGGFRQAHQARSRAGLEQAEENASVTQIALKCGFQNPRHFACDFRLHSRSCRPIHCADLADARSRDRPVPGQPFRSPHPEKRRRYSDGVTPRCLRKARRIRSSSPKPARFATSTTPPTCLLSSRSRAVSTRSASTPFAGVMPVRLT
jgi:AraC-like DNA-binding protein